MHRWISQPSGPPSCAYSPLVSSYPLRLSEFWHSRCVNLQGAVSKGAAGHPQKRELLISHCLLPHLVVLLLMARCLTEEFGFLCCLSDKGEEVPRHWPEACWDSVADRADIAAKGTVTECVYIGSLVQLLKRLWDFLSSLCNLYFFMLILSGVWRGAADSLFRPLADGMPKNCISCAFSAKLHEIHCKPNQERWT